MEYPQEKYQGLLKTLCGTTFSASTVSNLSIALDSRIAVFKERSLSKEYPYVFVDATYIKARIDENVSKPGGCYCCRHRQQRIPRNT